MTSSATQPPALEPPLSVESVLVSSDAGAGAAVGVAEALDKGVGVDDTDTELGVGVAGDVVDLGAAGLLTSPCGAAEWTGADECTGATGTGAAPET